MSNSNINNTTHGLANLGLGAPIGGGSSAAPTHSHIQTSSTSSGAPVGSSVGSGLNSHTHDAACAHLPRDHHERSSGLTGSSVGSGLSSHTHDESCAHLPRDHHEHSSGLTGSSSGARNTTSGDQGIGRGSGGTTAFESDASKVGESHHHHGSSEHGHHGFSGGQGAATAAGLTGAGAGLTHGNDRNLTSGSGLTGSHGHNSSNLTSGSRSNDLTESNHGHQHDVKDHKADFTGVHEKGSHGLGHLHGERDLVNESGLEGHATEAREHNRATGGLGAGAGAAGLGAAGLAAGHHAQSTGTHTSSGLTGSHNNTSGLTGSRNTSSGLTGNHGSTGHHGAAVGAGAAGLAVGGAVGLTGREATRMDADGVVADSVTGQTHFVEGQGLGQQGLVGQQGLSTHGSSGLGAGAAGLAGGAGLTSQGQGHGLKDKLTGGSSSRGTNDGPLAELKQELKAHESGQAGHAVDHPESKGPHGLVWHNGKYVHEREISGHGSTGVPLR